MHLEYKGLTGAIAELDGSPRWNKTEGSTVCTRKFVGMYQLLDSMAPLAGSWAVNGAQRGMKISEVDLECKRPNGVGVLTLKYTGAPISGDGQVPLEVLPNDTVGIEWEVLDWALENHEAFEWLLEWEIQGVHQYVAGDSKLRDFVQSDPLTLALSDRLMRGQTHFRREMPVYVWTSFFWYPPLAEVGGYQEIPPSQIDLPPGMAWLRWSDILSFDGKYWMLKRRWAGAPYWDELIYPHR